VVRDDGPPHRGAQLPIHVIGDGSEPSADRSGERRQNYALRKKYTIRTTSRIITRSPISP